MPSLPHDPLPEHANVIVDRVVTGVSTGLKPMITSGFLGGGLLAIVVTVIADDGSALEVWHGHIADLPEADWPEDSYGIARAKTALTLRTGLTAEQVHKSHPGLLLPGDVEWWGNTQLQIGGRRVIVSASGLDEIWDQRICEAIADLLVIALAS
ncbi:hypothetical protein GFY24_35285 [Nocardia sp. SYP-A9097]|uniref:hypothetical protein n=1 Tax=Nocardia sp. SYP-A9097 TaxID=2663237 RepID=UPI00129BE1E9|nr:hypothetical protein [Nocardia sp. SYP-A9097]MRH92626.1 hypothetical protein [Nocardia sp. SYP-A9097]